jgi:hypothetical protein
MDPEQAGAHWREHGYALLPGFLSETDIHSAQEAMSAVFPTADEFHDDVDPVRNAPFRDEFGGILDFPWAAVELCLLAVRPRLVELAETVLATTDLRLYSAEAWAKYTGAAEYDQELHRDYLNHTPLVPSSDPRFAQLEMFVWLSDVTEAHGPTHVVSRQLTNHLPAWPNWLSRSDVPEMYEAEVSAAGPAGTVLAYSPATFHRGTAMTASRGARYSLHINFRPAAAEWANRHGWAEKASPFRPGWNQFVEQASPRQLGLFGFPPPGHPYWTEETLTGIAQRYEGLDVAAWRGSPADAPVRHN